MTCVLQVIWVCILCRKKQELLSKTGQWIQKGPQSDAIMRRIEADLQAGETPCSPAGDKRPKLERGLSAGGAMQGTENHQARLQRSGSALRRQYSQEAADVLVMRGGQQRGGLAQCRRFSAGSDAMLYDEERVRPRLVPPTPGGRKIPNPADMAGKMAAHKQCKRGKKTSARQHSLSSSEDELRSTPELISCDENSLIGGERGKYIIFLYLFICVTLFSFNLDIYTPTVLSAQIYNITSIF
jgi:regulating synaptic membrane exocytosis protein 2